MVRFKSRYLLCELCVAEQRSLQLLEEKALFLTLRSAVGRAHGEYGLAIFNIGVFVKYLNAHTGVMLIRCRKAHFHLIWSALPFITHLETRGQKIQGFINCLHVGGTIKTCQKFLIKYNRQQLNRMLLHCITAAEKEEVRRAIVSCSMDDLRGVDREEEESGDEDD